MRRSLFDDVLANLGLAATEQQIVGREVRVTEHVSGDKDVLCIAVALCEISATWIAGEDHFKQSR